MTDPILTIRERAIRTESRVVFAEPTEPRILRACLQIAQLKIAKPILIGRRDEINKTANTLELDIAQLEIADPGQSELTDSFAAQYFDFRKEKNISEENARTALLDPLNFGNMMVRQGLAVGSVAGSVLTTGEVIKSALRLIGTKDKSQPISSSFLMILPRFNETDNYPLLFADGAVIPFPDSAQLARIAIDSAKTFKKLLDIEPKVAMLSFSTKGSARHKEIQKILEAIEIVKKQEPEMIIDGEFQADAALIPEIAKRKAPGSVIAGDANVLIFPDLNSANIAYKLTERLAGAKAVGPILQGLSQPVSDLSRGCEVDDIIDATAITVLLAN